MSSFGFVLGPGLPPLFLFLPVPFPCAPSASCVPWLLSWPSLSSGITVPSGTKGPSDPSITPERMLWLRLGWALPDRGHGFFFFSWPVFGIFSAHPLGYAPRSHVEGRRSRSHSPLSRSWTHSPMRWSRCMHYSQGSPSWRNLNPKLRIEAWSGDQWRGCMH